MDTTITPPSITGTKVTDLDSYIELARVTESRDYAPVMERWNSQEVSDALRTSMAAAIAVGNLQDKIKKAIFYGKPTDLLTAMHECGEEIDRAAKISTLDPIPLEKLSSSLMRTRLMHAALGMMTEAAEIQSQIYDHLFREAPLDLVNIAEEKGDSDWYGAILFDLCRRLLGKEPLEVLQANIDKLKARYGEKFTEAASLSRDLGKEREVLETTLTP